MNTSEFKANELYTVQSDHIAVSLSGEAVNSIPSSGRADDAVEAVYRKALVTTYDPSIRDFTDDPDKVKKAIRRHLDEYGTWDEEELADDDANLRRVVWLAAEDIKEGDGEPDRQGKTRAKWESLGRKVRKGARPKRFEVGGESVPMYVYSFNQTQSA